MTTLHTLIEFDHKVPLGAFLLHLGRVCTLCATLPRLARILDMITSNILGRVFHIKFGESVATCFTIDVEDRQYFVTAKHVVEELKKEDRVEIWHQKIWKLLPTKLVGHHETADVSVFSSDTLIPAYPAPATTQGMYLGQDVYFLGFPLGLKSEVGEINRFFPLPLIKKGCLSTLPLPAGDQGEPQYFFVDGYNNRGFSGGPVIFTRPGESEQNICGIIHGYMFEEEGVKEIITDHNSRQVVCLNAGIMKVYSIQNALDLIEKNPIGTEIKKNESKSTSSSNLPEVE